MSKHTPKWIVNTHGEAGAVLIYDDPDSVRVGRFVCATQIPGKAFVDDPDSVRANRIRDCWNAMDGIADPAAFVEAAREFVAAFESAFPGHATDSIGAMGHEAGHPLCGPCKLTAVYEKFRVALANAAKVKP